jgi:hypothetical protein
MVGLKKEGANAVNEAIYTAEELGEAHRALLSTLKKCEKMDADKLPQSQRTLLERRIAALKNALDLIGEKLEDATP